MKTARIFLVAALLSGGWTSASALTGNDLYDLLSKSDSNSQLVVAAYFRGFTDAASVAVAQIRLAGGKAPDVLVCVPEGANLEQTRQLVMEELKTNVAMRHYAAGVFVYRALVRAWPCR